MFGNGQLTLHQQRKTVLLERSAARRRELGAAAQTLRTAAIWVDRGIEVASKARDGWAALAPLFSRSGEGASTSGFSQKLAGAVSVARVLAALFSDRR